MRYVDDARCSKRHGDPPSFAATNVIAEAELWLEFEDQRYHILPERDASENCVFASHFHEIGLD